MLVGAAILCLAGGGGNDELSLEEIEEKKGSFSAGASVHDPSVFKENGTYYIFGKSERVEIFCFRSIPKQ